MVFGVEVVIFCSLHNTMHPQDPGLRKELKQDTLTMD